MSKIVTIPTGGGNPFVVILGGVKYVYKPGETVEVPDGVALEIEEWERWYEKYYDENVPPFGAGGGGADWNQNDPNAPDYVKNRTHYEEFKTIIEEREARAWFDGGTFVASRMPQVGEKLTVTFNGETYECVAWESEGNVGLGNGEAVGVIDRGENVPFGAGFWVDDEGGAGAFIATAMIGENTISVVDNSGNTLIEGTFSVEVDVDEPMGSAEFPLDQPLIVGNTYKVVYDGVPYECVAWEEGPVCLGNGEIDGFEHSEDVPFLISACYVNGELVWLLIFYGNEPHTVSVSEVAVHKLDPKYLPDVGGGESGEVNERINQLENRINSAQETANSAQETANKANAKSIISTNKTDLSYSIEKASIDVGETITITGAIEPYTTVGNGGFIAIDVKLMYSGHTSIANGYVQQFSPYSFAGIARSSLDNAIFILQISKSDGLASLTRIV